MAVGKDYGKSGGRHDRLNSIRPQPNIRYFHDVTWYRLSSY